MLRPDQPRMLIIRLSALGDVAMTIPVIYSLARQYPELPIDLLTRPAFARLLIDAPANLHVIEADTRGRHRGLRGTVTLLRELASRHYTVVADLHNVLRSWVIDSWMRLKGARVAMVDKQRDKRRRLLKGRSEQQWDYLDRYLDVMSRLGYPVAMTFGSIFAGAQPQPPVPIAPGTVGIAPFARYYNKTYPPELMEQVVEQLSQKGVPVCLFGGRGREAAVLEQWEIRYPGVTSLAGRYTLDHELAAMSRLAVMVSMDSANQHLASLTGIPVVTIWGSTTPVCGFQPFGQDSSRGLCAGLHCQPCTIAGGPDCPRGTLDCMRALTPAMIVDKILSSLDR